MLCNDPIYIVRKKAAKKIYSLLNSLYDHQKYRECALKNINAFSL